KQLRRSSQNVGILRFTPAIALLLIVGGCKDRSFLAPLLRSRPTVSSSATSVVATTIARDFCALLHGLIKSSGKAQVQVEMPSGCDRESLRVSVWHYSLALPPNNV